MNIYNELIIKKNCDICIHNFDNYDIIIIMIKTMKKITYI